MTEKVKLPKEVCDALDLARKHTSDAYIIARICNEDGFYISRLLIEQDPDLIMKALVLGYEPEMTAEDQIKEVYFSELGNDSFYDSGKKYGIQKSLRIHGIKYDWLDGDAE